MIAGLALVLVLLIASPAASWPGITIAVVCAQIVCGVAVSVLTAAGQAALARLWFRHQIEIIRDEVITRVLEGTVPPAGPAAGWLAAIEAVAGSGRRRDVEAGCAVLAAFPADDDPDGGWPELTPAERARLAALAARARAEASACQEWSRPAALLLPGLTSRSTPPTTATIPD